MLRRRICLKVREKYRSFQGKIRLRRDWLLWKAE
jgi:hypothetical protein